MGKAIGCGDPVVCDHSSIIPFIDRNTRRKHGRIRRNPDHRNITHKHEIKVKKSAQLKEQSVWITVLQNGKY